MPPLRANDRVLDPDMQVAVLEPDVPRLTPHLRALGFILPSEEAELKRIQQSRFFLVRNNGPHDEPARCRRCKRRHAHFTLMCIERPFRGLDGALIAYTRVSRSHPRAQALMQRLGITDLEVSHPQTARTLRPDALGTDVLALAIGLAEPITEQEARRYERLIRQYDRTFTL